MSEGTCCYCAGELHRDQPKKYMGTHTGHANRSDCFTSLRQQLAQERERAEQADRDWKAHRCETTQAFLDLRDKVKNLAAANKMLAEALAPFDKWAALLTDCNWIGDACPIVTEPAWTPDSTVVCVRHVRAAAAALAKHREAQ